MLKSLLPSCVCVITQFVRIVAVLHLLVKGCRFDEEHQRDLPGRRANGPKNPDVVLSPHDRRRKDVEDEEQADPKCQGDENLETAKRGVGQLL